MIDEGFMLFVESAKPQIKEMFGVIEKLWVVVAERKKELDAQISWDTDEEEEEDEEEEILTEPETPANLTESELTDQRSYEQHIIDEVEDQLSIGTLDEGVEREEVMINSGLQGNSCDFNS